MKSNFNPKAASFTPTQFPFQSDNSEEKVFPPLDKDNSTFEHLKNVAEFIPMHLQTQEQIGKLNINEEFDKDDATGMEDESMQDLLILEDYPVTIQVPPLSTLDSSLFETGPILPLDYNLYAPPPTSTLGLASNQRTIQSFFISEDLRQVLSHRLDLLRASSSSSSSSSINNNNNNTNNVNTSEHLPRMVSTYHSLLHLSTNHKSHLYRANSQSDGHIYLLKRLEGFSLISTDLIHLLDQWTRTRHANIIALKEGFTTHDFHDDSLVFVYDYHPSSQSLYEKYFEGPEAGLKGKGSSFKRSQSSSVNTQLQESTLWSFTCQIASALLAIHDQGLSYRNVNLEKILLTGENRIRLSCVGVPDIVLFNSSIPLVQHQQDDLIAFGQVMVSLACMIPVVNNFHSSLEQIQKTFSMEFYRVIMFLLGPPNPRKSIHELISMLAPRLSQQFNLQQSSFDLLEDELCRELENSRLARLLIKLGFINERPEYGMDTQWAETGDRYLLKLFRDHVFHQVDSEGRPVLDLAHVISCLNMFDAGSTERIMLTSRDERSCLVVTYQDLKRCAESAFGDLLKLSPSPSKTKMPQQPPTN